MNFPGDSGNVEDDDGEVDNNEGGNDEGDESDEYFPEDSWPL